MEELLLVGRGTPAAVDDELDPVVCGIGCSPAQGTEESGVEVGHTRNLVIEDRRPVGDGAVGFAERSDDDEQAGDADLANPSPTRRRSCWSSVAHAASQGSVALPARMWFS